MREDIKDCGTPEGAGELSVNEILQPISVHHQKIF
jgi:hypothetical protein